MTVTITLPIPDPGLSPNARIHWAAKSRLTKQARQTACYTARQAVGFKPPRLSVNLTAQVTFYVPDNRRRDADNAQARCKAYMDGLTDAEVWTDDHRVTHLPLTFQLDKLNPRVVIVVTGEPGQNLFTAIRDKYSEAVNR